MKNQIIIDNLDFYINNFNGTGTNYKVCVYAQDIKESDMYVIDVYELGRDEFSEGSKRVSTLYVDSCGGMANEGALNELEELILDTLFVKQKHGIIRGF